MTLPLPVPIFTDASRNQLTQAHLIEFWFPFLTEDVGYATDSNSFANSRFRAIHPLLSGV